jgi:hypothetical protein
VCTEGSKQPQKICNITMHKPNTKCSQQCKISAQNRQKGSQKLFVDKSYGPRRQVQQLGTDAQHTYQLRWEQVDTDEIRAYAGDINSVWREKKNIWSIHGVPVSARRTYNPAVSTRTIHAQSMYRRTPFPRAIFYKTKRSCVNRG